MENHPISELQQRYGLTSRQAVYDRIKALSIEPVARGKISSDQLDKLDKLDKHLKSGGTLSDFESSRTEVMPAAIEPAAATAINQERENFLELIEAIARHIAATRDPLQHYTALERAIASGWLLSTAEVRSLIGTKPHGDRFQHGSFVFIRAGKIGAQAAWRVAKVVSNGNTYKV
ncbi:hypothetical protein [Microcoleus sp. OTE_8_concoct_300]|uniref:hypothetical protein n=1 Tax=Microcoleus sp. OTE_8_concoct_300 TaxID=2964710 RepID=UPI00403F1300